MKPDIEPLRETSEDEGTPEDTEDDSVSVDGPPSPGPVMKCQVREYEERHNFKGEKVMKLVEDKKSELDEKDEGKDFAMISYKIANLLPWTVSRRTAPEPYPDDFLPRADQFTAFTDSIVTRLEVNSLDIQKALRDVIKSYPGQSFNGETVILNGMLKCIFHYREELEIYRQNSTERSAKWHIGLLLRFMGKELLRSIRSYKAHVESVPANPCIEFHDLWMAFVPGEIMITGQNESKQIMILQSTELLKDSCGGQIWSITGRCFTHDGTNFGYSDKIIQVDGFSGTKEIWKLSIYPLKYYGNKEAIENIKEELIARGRKFCALAGGFHHRAYVGTASTVSEEYEKVEGTRTPCPPAGSQWKYRMDTVTLTREQVNSRIMVDTRTFNAFNTQNRIWLVERHKSFSGNEEDANPPARGDLMICDYQIPGFTLFDKKWCLFSVDFVQPIQFNTKAFESLLIPQKRKELVHALVKNHGTDDFDDLIKGKGKGLVFVLYGEPGVGKTFTAESIADDIKRPLYVLNTGELGVAPHSVETNLTTALKLATRWGAIVLIDEADVFLEQRTIHDLTRNSLVSLFLRVLEYYVGILFLTTNRLTSFDLAFKSRIHLALKYSALNQEMRKELWKVFIERTAKGVLQNWPESVNIKGRQIKNTIRTANTLAKSKIKALGREHIEVVLETMAELEEDLNSSTQDVVLS
ncbi:ATPase family AAA domain-containing 3B [Hyphodiscus hymeniophilus]|uniref:ATPase family AAA domain-containing 3B n=1 Tax=Hyphodiscus hymeniophilus TaxID=353542 RepID=A0A9P6VNH1_9HELO|nr:ATPase family AAA domain-containing 3B [Hyphodiscus hymeniophilus]